MLLAVCPYAECLHAECFNDKCLIVYIEWRFNKCLYAESLLFWVPMLSDNLPNVFMLGIFMLGIFMLGIFMLGIFMWIIYSDWWFANCLYAGCLYMIICAEGWFAKCLYSGVLLSVITASVIMPIFSLISGIMLNVIMANVLMQNVTAPFDGKIFLRGVLKTCTLILTDDQPCIVSVYKGLGGYNFVRVFTKSWTDKMLQKVSLFFQILNYFLPKCLPKYNRTSCCK
jgi:hypothetical protein